MPPADYNSLRDYNKLKNKKPCGSKCHNCPNRSNCHKNKHTSNQGENLKK